MQLSGILSFQLCSSKGVYAHATPQEEAVKIAETIARCVLDLIICDPTTATRKSTEPIHATVMRVICMVWQHTIETIE
jgi:hypothetical protein